MPYVTQGIGVGEISINIADPKKINVPREAWERLKTEVDNLTQVESGSTDVSYGGTLSCRVNLGKLEGTDLSNAIGVLYHRIVEKAGRTAQVYQDKLAAASTT